MVEVLSTFSGGGSQIVNLIADPQGINSTVPTGDRVQYALRAAADGSVPANTNVPTSIFSGDSVANFTVGLNDAWWVYNPSITGSNGVAAFVDQAVLETDVAGRTPGLGTGSRVLGILDTVASFFNIYGAATPGSTLDLHYWPGLDSGGSYVVYNRNLIPQSLLSSVYFGTLRGGPANDDAWDPGVILPPVGAQHPLCREPGPHLFHPPESALSHQCSPGGPQPGHGPDRGSRPDHGCERAPVPLPRRHPGHGSGGPLGGRPGHLRPRRLSAGPLFRPGHPGLCLGIILKANNLPSPGTVSDWANVNPLAAARFFVTPGGATGTAANGTAIDLEPLNIFTQINRLKEGKASTEPVDLAAVFTDAVLTNLGTPFGLPWPRPTTGAYTSFVGYWGTDPTGALLPPVVLSMAKATQVTQPYPGPTLAYPNVLRGGGLLHRFQPDRGQALHPHRHDHTCAPGWEPGGGGPSPAAH